MLIFKSIILDPEKNVLGCWKCNTDATNAIAGRESGKAEAENGQLVCVCVFRSVHTLLVYSVRSSLGMSTLITTCWRMEGTDCSYLPSLYEVISWRIPISACATVTHNSATNFKITNTIFCVHGKTFLLKKKKSFKITCRCKGTAAWVDNAFISFTT